MLDQAVPAFSLPATSGKSCSLADFRGRLLALYFYPKDSTPGCTTEAQDFRDLYPAFEKLDCAVLGVSRDSLRSHENFRAKQSLPFELLSDIDEILCTQFAVIKEKKMYGRLVRGIERSTFVIDQDGVLRREWRGVKTAGHAQEVLDYVASLASA